MIICRNFPDICIRYFNEKVTKLFAPDSFTSSQFIIVICYFDLNIIIQSLASPTNL